MLKPIRIFFITVLSFLLFNAHASIRAKTEFYQIKIYHLTTAAQEQTVDDFLRQAYLPAMHRAGIKNIGVFKPIAVPQSTAASERLIYVFIPFRSNNDFFKIGQKLEKDTQYLRVY